jgi:Flp pilus assembly protein TadG
MQQNMPGAGGAALLFGLIMIIAGSFGYLLFIIAAWRMMKAHEAVAQAVKTIARQLERPETRKPDIDGFTLGE